MATDKLIPIIVAAALFFWQSAQAAQISPATAIQSCTDAVRMTVDPQFLAYFGRDQKMHFLATRAELNRATYLFGYCMDRVGYSAIQRPVLFGESHDRDRTLHGSGGPTIVIPRCG